MRWWKAPAVRASRHRASPPHRFRCRRRPARQLCLSKSRGESGLLRSLAFRVPAGNANRSRQPAALATTRSPIARATAGALSSSAKSFTASLLAKPRPCHPVAWLPLTTKSATRAAKRALASSNARRISRCEAPNWISATARARSAGVGCGSRSMGWLLFQARRPGAAAISSITRRTISVRSWAAWLSRTWPTTRVHNWFNPAALLHYVRTPR